MKTLKSFLAFLFLSSGLYGQFYVEVSCEYSFPALKQQLGSNNIFSPGNHTTNGIYSSYGAGFSPQVFLVYKIKQHISVELGYSYLVSAKQTFTSAYSSSYNPGYSSSYTSSTLASMHRIQPGVRFSWEKNKFGVYNSFRIIVGAGGELIANSNYTDIDTTSINHGASASKTYGGLSSGFSDAIGVTYKFKSFGIFMDADFICQSWAPQKGRATKNEYNGVDQLSSMPVSWKEYEYVNPGIESSAMTDNPSQHPKFYLPFSSIGFNVGIYYSF